LLEEIKNIILKLSVHMELVSYVISSVRKDLVINELDPNMVYEF